MHDSPTLSRTKSFRSKGRFSLAGMKISPARFVVSLAIAAQVYGAPPTKRSRPQDQYDSSDSELEAPQAVFLDTQMQGQIKFRNKYLPLSRRTYSRQCRLIHLCNKWPRAICSIIYLFQSKLYWFVKICVQRKIIMTSRKQKRLLRVERKKIELRIKNIMKWRWPEQYFQN